MVGGKVAAWIVGMTTAVLAQACAAQSALPVPPGGDPAMACGQKPDGRAYWTEYAFCNVAVRGPGKAKGLILWSHGVDGTKEQYRSSLPSFMGHLSAAGWDVVKIARNNLHEQGWMASGRKHVDDLIARGQNARARGYERVVAAGQSYGGVISLEAGAKAKQLFHAIVATSPGHGSDAPTGQSNSSRGAYYNLDRYLLEALSGLRDARVLVSLPPGDVYHPNRDGNPIGQKVRDVLTAAGVSFVQFDETLPIGGHGAAYTGQFLAWFGDCIRDFLDPGGSPPGGETRCPPPATIPKFLLPAGLKIPSPGDTGPSRWLGAWEGVYVEDRRQVLIVVERAGDGTAAVIYAAGSGPNRDLSMGFNRYSNARLTGDTLTIERGNGRTLTLVLSADGARVAALHRGANGTEFKASLIRVAGGAP